MHLKNKTVTTRSTGRKKQGDISHWLACEQAFGRAGNCYFFPQKEPRACLQATHWRIQGQRNLALYLLLFTSSIGEKSLVLFIYIPVMLCYDILSSIVKKWLIFTA